MIVLADRRAAFWLEATNAINAHGSDRSGVNVARPSRQPSRSNAVVCGDEYGRQYISLQLHSANLGNVRAGGDCRQPWILQSEPELPRARIRAAQGQAEAILLLIRASSALGSVAAFALAARKDGLGEEPCARSVLFCSVSQ